MQHWSRYHRNSKQRTYNNGFMLNCVKQRGDSKNQGQIDDDLRSSASERIFGERSTYLDQTAVLESEHFRFLVGNPSSCSHEHRVDVDSGMSVRRKNRLSEVLSGKNHPPSPLAGLDVSTSKVRRHGSSIVMPRRSQNKALNKVKEKRPVRALVSDAGKVYGKTNQVAVIAEEDEVSTETKLQGSRRMGESFKIAQTNIGTQENRADIERVSDFEIESGVNENIGGQGHMTGSSGCFGCVASVVRSLPVEKSTLVSYSSSENVSQELQYRKSNVGSYSSGRGSTKRSLRRFSCISSADVLPSVTANGVPNPVINRQKLETHNTKHKSGGFGSRIRKGSVCTAGCLVHRNSQSESGGLTSEETVPVVNPLPARSRRVSGAVFRGSKWCLKPNSVKADAMASSTDMAFVNGAMQESNVGHSGGGREVPRILTESCIELASPSLEGNSNRVLSVSVRQPGQTEVDKRSTTRTWVNHGVSNTTLSLMHDNHSGSSSIFSGPPSTLRTPSVLSPVGTSELPRSVDVLSSPSSYMSSPEGPISNSGFHFSYASNPQSPDVSRGVSSPEFHDGHGILPFETPVYRPFQQRSSEESRFRFMYDGISQVLSGREHAERDRISNEQYFMLDANFLFGGMAAYDQHRDMRLDVDNMSYEELLALEESIGNVCTGLGRDVISRCLTSKNYACLHSDGNLVPQESEIKCSVCQEEFEEGVQLGVLECGHSHHFLCIEQWLLQKNLCPICKTSASS